MGKALGFRVRTAVGTHPKVYFQTVAADGTPLRLKVEVNTYERSPAHPVVELPYQVSSDWFSGTARVRTFSPSELSATKIRALYQRKKGRDLFDLWLALTELGITGEAILKAFAPYRPSGLTRRTATDNLLRKLGNSEFREDLAPLVSDWPANYDIDTAGQLIIDEVHARL